MKKVLLILLAILLVGCTKEEELLNFKYTAYYEYMMDNSNNIEKVEAIMSGDNGDYCYDVTSLKEDIYDYIINIKILSKSDIVVSNDITTYKFIFNDGEIIEFNFNGSFLTYNNVNYDIDGTYNLAVNELNDLKFDCKLK